MILLSSMQDLIDKIEELKKSLAAMKPKGAQQNSLVPALKPPGIKPLSVSSTPAKPAQIPGVSTASTKDPKKMAEQLKNPRPKKPKIEMLKVANNGQWELIHKANEFRDEPDQDFMSYNSTTLHGHLPQDHGQKGLVHNVGTVRAPKKTSKHKMEGKVPTPVQSAAVARNPGTGLE